MNREKPLLLDLYCKAGGCTKGYQQAGFYVVGVDIEPQPNYCGDQFMEYDAIELLKELVEWGKFVPERGVSGGCGSYVLGEIAGIHASPPCQLHSNAHRIRGRDHPELIAPTRELLRELGLPYVIENVPGAPLIEPHLLCGTMFGLKTYRHRLFEVSFPYAPPLHGEHVAPQTKMGRPPKSGEFIQVVGNFSGVAFAREAMQIDWMSRNEMSEAIPPPFTRHIGLALLGGAQ